MALTEVGIRQAKPRDKDWKLADSGGLYLLIRPNGSKLWKMKFRANGKEQKLSFGPYPEVSLKEARRKRDEARVEIGRGGDPARRKREDKIAAELKAGHRFADIATEFIAKCEAEGFATATLTKSNWFLKLAQKDLGDRPIADITPHEVLSVLKKLERDGKRETARRLRSFLSRVFRFAVATLRADKDPTEPLRGALTAPITRHYAAIIEPKALGGLLRAIDSYDGFYPTRFALLIAPHVFVRPGELRQADWSEFDLAEAVWRIPAGRMKSRRRHEVPLSKQVVVLLSALGQVTGRSGYVFASLHARGRPMSENTLNAALRRLGYSTDEMTAHGFRATASTLLNESGQWSSDAIERALAHKDGDAVRATYHRGKHWDERVKMAQWWSDYLDELRGAPSVAVITVEPFGASRQGHKKG